MSRLKSNHHASKIQPEVIGLVHDEVVSLCHRMYASISGIEIDGIICISLLDTKEQQVVKIHKTLKSVIADVARKSSSVKNRAYPKIASILSAGNPANLLEHLREERPVGDVPNFQKDISTLNDLLKASNAIIRTEAEAELESKRSKRKRKPPKHRSDMVYDAENEDSQDRVEDAAIGNRTETNEDSAAENVDISNTITVKEEPHDPGYGDDADVREITLAYPKVTDYSSLSCSSKDNERETPENDASSFYIREQRNTSESTERSPEPDHRVTENGPVDGKVKSEYTDDDGEYGKFVEQPSIVDTEQPRKETDQNCDSTENKNPNDEVPAGWLYPETCGYESLKRTVRKSQEAEKHWLYGISKQQGGEASAVQDTMTNEVTRMALAGQYYQKGSIAHEGYPREVQRQEKDPLGRSWIEMVKDNVTKYQAALMRSVNKKQSDEPAAGSASVLLKSLAAPRSSLLNADNLKALLKEPPLQVDRARLMVDSGVDLEESARRMRDKSLTLNTNSSSSDKSRSASVSPAPVVKIEVDEDVQSYGQEEDKLSEDTGEGDKPPSGKLESRYPALFNQLQQAKKSGTPNLDQSDSLVNRLPFISFQELFAPANPGAAGPRMSDATTKQLLEQAKVNPYQKVAAAKKKSVWKWKKRHVRSKNNEGGVLSDQLVASELSEADSGDTTEQTKPLEINTSPKKTFSRKRQKEDDTSDTEWTPAAAAINEDVQDYGSGDNMEGGVRKKIKTRLSTGEKPRINFAEIENSDIDVEEEIKEEPEEPIELVSAYCRNSCGVRCTSFTELKIHEENCTWNPAGVGGAGGVVGAEATGTSGDNFKCTLCGLDFNQEYRWHYHMVKVHGVAADKTVLFR